jgi:hypothetical protein
MSDLPVQAGVAGIGQRAAITANPLTAALTPEEMWTQLVQSLRGFESSPSGAADAARRQAATLPPGALAPGAKGQNVGKGFETFGSIQIIDDGGKRLAIGSDWFSGGGIDAHAEAKVIRALDRGGLKAEGGRIVVVVDQAPCPHCTEKLKALSRKLGADLEVHVPEREALRMAGKTVSPKTAAVTSFKDLPKTTKLKQLWTHKAPPVPKTPPPAPTRANTGVRGAVIGVVGSVVIGLARDAFAKEMRETMAAVPRTTVDKRNTKEFLSDRRVGRMIRLVDLLWRNLDAFRRDLRDHVDRVVTDAAAECLHISLTQLTREEKKGFLVGLGTQIGALQDDLTTMATNLDAALEQQPRTQEAATTAERMASLIELDQVASYLHDAGLVVEEIAGAATNLRSFSSNARDTFATIQGLKNDVDAYRKRVDDLTFAIAQVFPELVMEMIRDQLTRDFGVTWGSDD